MNSIKQKIASLSIEGNIIEAKANAKMALGSKIKTCFDIIISVHKVKKRDADIIYDRTLRVYNRRMLDDFHCEFSEFKNTLCVWVPSPVGYIEKLIHLKDIKFLSSRWVKEESTNQI